MCRAPYFELTRALRFRPDFKGKKGSELALERECTVRMNNCGADCASVGNCLLSALESLSLAWPVEPGWRVAWGAELVGVVGSVIRVARRSRFLGFYINDCNCGLLRRR